MQESIKLHTHCPNCGAAKDYDTQGARHYTCGTYGLFLTGHYTSRCTTGFARTTCTNCDDMTKLVKLQEAEIKALRDALAATGCNDLRFNMSSKREETWVCRDGRRIKVADMSEDHAKNALRMMIRHVRTLEPVEDWEARFWREEFPYGENQ